MTRRRKSSDFTLARDLGPAGAPAAREALIDWLAAQDGAGAIVLERGEAPVSPLALQLLVAASRSRLNKVVPFGPAATAALLTCGVHAQVED